MTSIEISSRPIKPANKFPFQESEMHHNRRSTFYLDKKAVQHYKQNMDQIKTNLMRSYNMKSGTSMMTKTGSALKLGTNLKTEESSDKEIKEKKRRMKIVRNR